MKKAILGLFLVCFVIGGVCFVIGGVSFANYTDILISQGCKPQTLKTTSYYSPKSDQSFYYKGNEKDEKVLNGNGTHGASGKEVFDGMLAGSSSYDFGTKIYFPGIGWGSVEDRGGAIVNSGEKGQNYDRIDIRAGDSELGLVRALTRGVQTINARVCPSDTNMIYKDGSKADYGFEREKIAPIRKYFFTQTLFIQNLEYGRQDVWVSELQRVLIKLGYMPAGNDTGKFGPMTSKAVCDFQLDHEIVSDPKSERCGYYGVQTRFALKNNYKKFIGQDFQDNTDLSYLINYARNSGKIADSIVVNSDGDETIALQGQQDKDSSLRSELQQSIQGQQDTNSSLRSEGNTIVVSAQDSKYIDLDPNSQLQKRLKLLGFYSGPITGKFDDITSKALSDFQKSHNLILSEYGFLDTKTVEILNNIDRKWLIR